MDKHSPDGMRSGVSFICLINALTPEFLFLSGILTDDFALYNSRLMAEAVLIKLLFMYS